MPSLTAIELGGDTCALAKTVVRQTEVQVSAVEALDPGAFPGTEAFVMAVRQARRALKFPRRARVVVWGLPDGAKRSDPAVQPALAPLVAAGFRIERVVSPCNALAALARIRPPRPEGATCWIAVNRGGVAIVVVRPGRQLYAHSFVWDSTIGAVGSQARLLQRYSLVAHLAPEIQRAMAAARTHGMPVLSLITCGNLPDLRSLTMPLIEELDVEVETLDSLEGLLVKPDAAERLADAAPAIRLACAGAVARPSRPFIVNFQRHPVARVLGKAAAILLLVGAVGLGVMKWHQRTGAPPTLPPMALATPPAGAPAAAPAVPVVRPPAVATPPVTAPVAPSNQAPASSAAPARGAGGTTHARPPAPPGAVTTTHRAAPVSATPVPSKPSARDTASPAAPSKRSAPVLPPRATTPPAAQPSVRTPVVEAGARGVNSDRQMPDTPDAARPARNPPARLADPLPNVSAILLESNRRLATVEGGQIVGVGDMLGRRQVVAIDQRSVLLREPSGVQIRVGFGGRLIGVEGRID